jgi:hypothetical protein
LAGQNCLSRAVPIPVLIGCPRPTLPTKHLNALPIEFCRTPFPEREASVCRRVEGERVERNFAHQFDSGGMDRLYVRGLHNVHKKLLIQAAACNLALLMRSLYGAGKPRAAHDRWGQLTFTILRLYSTLIGFCQSERALPVAPAPIPHRRRCAHREILRASKTDGLVAVGTTVARRPPHRSVHAALPHTAPTSDA